jgi:SET domain-containing protein
MKSISFLSDDVFVMKSIKKGRGRGIFTKKALPANTTIEISPVVVLSPEERKHIEKTLLHNYIFEWGPDRKQCCVALGYISLYNHAYISNCEYEMDFRRQLITIRTVQKVKAGEELLINYNGEWNNETEIWFDVK